MPKSRVDNSIINTVYGFGVKLASLLSSFVLRTVFIRVLGMEYAGVSGLFTDVLTVLSFAELGISTAMTYALYRPISENDEDEIRKLMHFYKWAYRLVAGGVLVIGVLCIPFLPAIVKNVPNIKESLILIYMLYLINTVVSYLLIYKSTLLTASQKNYEISKTTIWISLFKCILGCILLLVFSNFIIYLCMEIALAVLQNLLIGHKAGKFFPQAFCNDGKHLEKREVRKLFRDIKALFLYKISGVVLNGTDSIIISSFLGTGLVGILANYNLIVKNVYKLILQVFASTSAGIGNLAVTESKEKQQQIFQTLLFTAFWLFGFCSVEFYVGLNSLMTLWMGAENTFSAGVVAALIVDFYVTGMMSPVSSFRTSNGLFVQGQYRPLIMTVINIAVSLLLVGRLGVLGVLLGTIVSRLATQVWYDPYLIYTTVFERSVTEYLKRMAVYTALTVACCIICQVIQSAVAFVNLFVQFIVMAFVSAAVFNVMCIAFFRNTEELAYLKNTGRRLLRQVKRKVAHE